MKPSWREISQAIGAILFFGIMGYNLYTGNGIFNSIFRGLIVLLLFHIISLLVSNMVLRQLRKSELRRFQEMQEEEEEEEEEGEEEAKSEPSGAANEGRPSSKRQDRAPGQGEEKGMPG